ncbi:hypothetical protein RI129_005241 [Pyrocoelia pectoralis]|uniref:Hexosyltransferase n=1 Tax=Pyrocoelia pectoralis TaxID=417401 RepID=A0AAN7ZLB6_9COLE
MSFRNLILKLKFKYIIAVTAITCIVYVLGLFTHLLEEDFYLKFTYPYNVNIEKLLYQLHNNESVETTPINVYNYKFLSNCRQKCTNDHKNQIKLVYIVKSSLDNFKHRNAIRQTWGYERRFSDVQIRTVFILGIGNNADLQSKINNEYLKYRDIVQINFEDSYFNNTIKTMMGFKWVINFCYNSNFYMFVDDDYYISTRNILRFIRNPTNYPQYLTNNELDDFELPSDVRLYAGYVFFSSPHRHLFSKWYVSLHEYPYHLWPPYVTAGAYILTRKALFDMYHGSFYTKHFRFDDIYLGLIAKKVAIEPFHCEHFHFYKQTYTDGNYKFTIASHGYESPSELLKVWNRQKSIGNA